MSLHLCIRLPNRAPIGRPKTLFGRPETVTCWLPWWLQQRPRLSQRARLRGLDHVVHLLHECPLHIVLHVVVDATRGHARCFQPLRSARTVRCAPHDELLDDPIEGCLQSCAGRALHVLAQPLPFGPNDIRNQRPHWCGHLAQVLLPYPLGLCGHPSQSQTQKSVQDQDERQLESASPRRSRAEVGRVLHPVEVVHIDQLRRDAVREDFADLANDLLDLLKALDRQDVVAEVFEQARNVTVHRGGAHLRDRKGAPEVRLRRPGLAPKPTKAHLQRLLPTALPDHVPVEEDPIREVEVRPHTQDSRQGLEDSADRHRLLDLVAVLHRREGLHRRLARIALVEHVADVDQRGEDARLLAPAQRGGVRRQALGRPQGVEVLADEGPRLRCVAHGVELGRAVGQNDNLAERTRGREGGRLAEEPRVLSCQSFVLGSEARVATLRALLPEDPSPQECERGRARHRRE
mmetsp:Transcript_52540/g.72034  ORF Transcript_52540/g.72034 Transcript_52540/m.72034 type:complete len:462 (+) Transcript_52540:186-1571(+)